MNQTKKWDDFYLSKTREPFLHFTDNQIETILREFPNAKLALDIGCGEGQLMVQLEKRTIATVGIDLSDVAITEARKHVKGVLIKDDFQNVNFTDGQQFDLIFVKFVIAFIHDLDGFFKKVKDLLKESGGLIVLTPVIQDKLESNIKSNTKEDIFIKQSILDTFMRKYFQDIKEEILHMEGDKKLSLFLCTKITETGTQQ